jgi:hypothetical protein
MMTLDQIMDFESGQMDDDEIIKMVQDGINSGEIWSLQGSYGRLAMSLINEGLCTVPEKNDYN